MVDALIARTAEIAADDALRVVVVQGAGKHFMAGGDIRTFATHLDEPPATRRDGFRRMVERLHAAIECLHRMPHPVIGRVQGAVAGFGLSLMNACDLVVAAEDAYFASAYRQIALTPDGGGSWSLPRLVGVRKAMEIFLLSERFGAADALALGIVNKVVPLARARCRDRSDRPLDCRGAGAGDAKNEATRARIARAHALRAIAGRGGELLRVFGEPRFRRRDHGVSREARAAVRPRMTPRENRWSPSAL